MKFSLSSRRKLGTETSLKGSDNVTYVDKNGKVSIWVWLILVILIIIVIVAIIMAWDASSQELQPHE